MRVRLATLAGVLCCLFSQAQSSVFEQVKSALARKYPGIQLENKIIACSFWSQDDNATREMNVALDKSVKTYRVARLTGGSSGMVGVAISLGSEGNTALTTLSYDGVEHLVSLDLRDLGQDAAKAPQMIVYDSVGRELYRNLQPGDIFMSINKLITR